MTPNCGDHSFLVFNQIRGQNPFQIAKLFFLVFNQIWGQNLFQIAKKTNFFFFKARFCVFIERDFLQKNIRKFGRYTSKFINGQRVPIYRKFGKPWSGVSK